MLEMKSTIRTTIAIPPGNNRDRMKVIENKRGLRRYDVPSYLGADTKQKCVYPRVLEEGDGTTLTILMRYGGDESANDLALCQGSATLFWS